METRQPKPLPVPNSDFYELVETLPAEELAVVKQVRAFMETKVAPIITKYWSEDSFPFELLPAIKELNIGGVGMQGYGCRGGSELLFGLAAMEMARVDTSIATFFGVHNGLAMGSIYLGSSDMCCVAAADGSLGKGRLLRAHWSRSSVLARLAACLRPPEPRGGNVGAQRPEAVDWQCNRV